MLFLNKEMEIMKKSLVGVLLLLLLMTFLMNFCLASGLKTEITGTANDVSAATGAVNRIWNSVRLVLQVLSITIVLACGVRYMLASADQKADIKKSLGILVIGCAIVFGATIVIQFITTIAGQIFV